MIRSFGWNEFVFLLWGVPWTIGLTLIACIVGGLIGFGVAVARISKLRVPVFLSVVYIQVIEGTPVLMLLFLVYYFLALYGINVQPLLAASVAMSLFASGYFADIWRGALQSVSRHQWEAGESLAMTRASIFFDVILPQAIRISIPPTVGFIVQIVKNSAAASIIGFVELTRAGQLMNNLTFQPFQVFLSVALIYLILCYPISWASRILEKRLQHA